MAEEKIQVVNTYEEWLKQEGIPVIKDYSIKDMMQVPLKPWKRKGGNGAFINLVGSEQQIDSYLCEIPSGGSLKPQRHLYEEVILILDGRGATTVWATGGKKHTFEWQRGSLFSPPLNVWHQHFNGQGDKPARYLGVTLAPITMNLFHDIDFVFNTDWVFKGRYNEEDEFFSSKGKKYADRVWESNFIPDVYGYVLKDYYKERGAGGTNINFEMSADIMNPHISEFPVGTYKKGHRHGPGAHIVILNSTGYSLIWPEGGERIKIDWKLNSLFAPPDRWFHQHFNTGKDPARYLAVKAGGAGKYAGIRKHYQTTTSVSEGGDQIEYREENPEIRKLYKQELAKTGAIWKMTSFFPGE